MSEKRVAVITGASSGIGAATAAAMSREGFEVVIGARRRDRLWEVAKQTDARALPLDVTDTASVDSFVAQIWRADVLVNNAGGALGVDPVESAPDDRWRTMWEVNFLGTVRMTRALLPRLQASGNGHIINVGSIAGFETYLGGGGYTGAKHATRALTKTLRLELLGQPIRVTEVSPGLVETEFAMVRFDQDEERARAVYAGMQPLVADDIAECITWAATRPAHVNIDEIVVRPRDQATATAIHRRET